MWLGFTRNDPISTRPLLRDPMLGKARWSVEGAYPDQKKVVPVLLVCC